MAVVTRRSRAAGRVFGLGDFPPNALGQAALAILASLPSGSGVNPIGKDPAYPVPHDPAQDNVVDTVYGGNRYVDWYNAHPVSDPSGLIVWTGTDTGQKVPGLSQAQNLAAQVLLSGGDDSWSADIHPPNAIQATQAPSAAAYAPDPVNAFVYTPTNYAPTHDGETPPPDLLQHPIVSPTALPVVTQIPSEPVAPAPPVVSLPVISDLPSGSASSGGSGVITPISQNAQATGSAFQQANDSTATGPLPPSGGVMFGADDNTGAAVAASGGMLSGTNLLVFGGVAAAIAFALSRRKRH